MPIWSAEIKELEKLYETFKGQLPELEKELGKLIKADDENMILLYSRRCLEVIITILCECELKRERGTEPLKGIIDKLNKEKIIPAHIVASMHSLNSLSTFGTHPKEFDPRQVKPVLNNLSTILEWYLKYKNIGVEEATEKPVFVDDKISAKRSTKKKPDEISSFSLIYRLTNLPEINPKAWRIITLVFIVISIGSIWLYLSKALPPPDRAEIRYDIPLTDGLDRLRSKSLAISPDGKYLAYLTNEGLNLLHLNSDKPSEPIPGTTNSNHPFFSPDSKWIGFVKEGKIMKISLTGGNPVTLCDPEGITNGIDWCGNEIIFPVGNAIFRVPDSGGTPEQLYPLVKSENDPIVWNPQLLPDKKTILFSQQQQNGEWSIMTWTLRSKESPSVLVERGHEGRYLKTGYLVYSLNNHLFTSKFNSRTNRIVSEPQIISTNLIQEMEWWANTQSQFDFSDNGLLVYYEVQGTTPRHLVWVDESGHITPPVTRNAKVYIKRAISSNGQNIAASILNIDRYQIVIINTETGNSSLFVEDARLPLWSADNSYIYYTSTKTNNQVFQKPLDLSTPPQLLFEIDSAFFVGIHSISSDGKYILFDVNFNTKWGIGYYDITNNKIEILEHYNNEGNNFRPYISPDGKWLAYQSFSDLQNGIYVAPFPGPGTRRLIALDQTNANLGMVWSPDMTALYYNTNYPDYNLWKIKMKASDNNFTFETAQPFFNGGNRYFGETYLEIHPNGDRFLILQRDTVIHEDFEPRIKVIVNWEQELKNN
jgi:Tol biopolymer transport system component